MTATKIPSQDELLALHMKLRDLELERWLHEDLFSWRWWLMFAVTFFYYTVWWKTVRKDNLVSILLLGSLVTVMSIILDIVGLEMFWWSYPHKLFPLMPPFLVFDTTHLPINFMWIYQCSKTWKQYLLRITLLSAALAFLIEPFLVWLGVYRLDNWHYLFSFPIYILVAVFARAAVQGIYHKQNKTRRR